VIIGGPLASPCAARQSRPGSLFRSKFFAALHPPGAQQMRRNFFAGLNVMVLALPLSMAFAIASGVKPEQGLYTAIIGGAIVAALSGSPVQIGGPTGAFVIITATVLQHHGLSGLLLCTMMAGAMLCVMGFARMGTVIRFIPYPVSRALTKGIAVLILGSQINQFFGLGVADMPVDFPGKVRTFATHLNAIHAPTCALALASVALIAFWPQRLSRIVPGTMVGLVVATAVTSLFGLDHTWGQRLDEQFNLSDATAAKDTLRHLCQHPDGRNRAQILNALVATRQSADPAAVENQLARLLLMLQRDGYLLESSGRYAFRSFLLREYWHRREVR